VLTVWVLAGVEYVEGAASMFTTMMDGEQAALLVKAKVQHLYMKLHIER